jgi:hypothetical protein
MRQGWKRAAALSGVAAALLAGIGMLLLPSPLDWRAVAGVVVAVGFVVALGVLITQDSAARGRSGWGWLAACALLTPLALPAFVVIAVYDRLRGRRGIEARWSPGGRWYVLGGLVLVVVAAGLAVSPVDVPGVSVSVPGASGSFSGSCSSALSVSLGTGSYGRSSYWQSGAPAVLTDARTTVAGRCSAVASDRMRASGICLGGALVLALAGLGMNRRRGSRLTEVRSSA